MQHQCPGMNAYAGGGVALLYASRGLEATKETLANFDQQIGVQIVQNALRVPLKTIADNAGVYKSNRCWLQADLSLHMHGAYAALLQGDLRPSSPWHWCSASKLTMRGGSRPAHKFCKQCGDFSGLLSAPDTSERCRGLSRYP